MPCTRALAELEWPGLAGRDWVRAVRVLRHLPWFNLNMLLQFFVAHAASANLAGRIRRLGFAARKLNPQELESA